MAIFKPFKAYRPSSKVVEALVSKPYDVLSAEEARKESSGNSLSFYRVIKPEVDFPEDQDQFDEKVYSKGKENLKNLIDQGIMIQDTQDQFYVYRIKMGDHEQTGLVGCCSSSDYFDGVIKRHELTNPAVEESRKKHIVKSEFLYEPVFFTYPKVDEISKLVKQITYDEPTYDFISEDGHHHTVWVIKGAVLNEKISTLFAKKVPIIYIADGHHRTAAGALASKELSQSTNGHGNGRLGDLMSVLFPHDEVQILDYNRAVKDLNGLSENDFLYAVSASFDIVKKDASFTPASHAEIGMYLGAQWFQLKAKDGTYDQQDLVDKLGFTILSKQILEPILGIQDLRRDKRIEFVGGIRGFSELEKMVNKGDSKVAFAMHPISITELMDIADHNLLLPPKVTWFEPKLRSGLFVHKLTEG